MKHYAVLALTAGLGFGLTTLVGCGGTPSASESKDAKSAIDKAKDMADKAGDKMKDMADKGKDMLKELGGKITEMTANIGKELEPLEAKIAELGKAKDAEGLGADKAKALTEQYTNANGIMAKIKEMIAGLNIDKIKDMASFEKIGAEIKEKIAELKKTLGIM